MTFIQDLKARGYFYQCTGLESLEELMEGKKIAAYVGFDCTAQSLHVGNLMQIMIMRLFQQHGHKPIVIVGGGTSKVGDPSGRDETRKILTDDELNQNIAGIKHSLSKFIKFGNDKSDAIIVNNADWLDSLNYIDFLRDYGRLFSVNRMLTMDSVKLRLEREQPLTFLEFNYMLLQAYDFYHLSKEYDCQLQFGGSDQWGNIVMGTDLCHKLGSKEVYGITTPLLTTSSGAKMGKSASGAVWLNETMLSPYEYYQYWRNCEDLDVVRFAKLYAEFNDEKLEEFEALAISDINEAKKTLAYNLTKLCHGFELASQAMETSRKLFETGEIDENLPTINIERKRLEQGASVSELFLEIGFSSSKSEAKKLIRGGGAKINDIKVVDENMLIDSHLFDKDIIKVSAGKKRHALIKVI